MRRKWGGEQAVSYPEPMPTDLVLAGEFPPADHEQWAAAVAKALDRTGELAPEAALARLRTTTYDGITIEPLYTAADAPAPDAAGFPGGAPYERGRTAAGTQVGGWDVRQRVDAGAGAGRAVEELERGATSVLLDLRGVDAVTAEVVGAALEGVLLDLAPVVLDAGARWQAAAEAVGEHLHAGSLGADPLGEAAAGTNAADGSDDVDAELDAVAAWISRLGDDRPDLRVITVDGTRFHDAGASDAQQLGATIAAGIDYLRGLDERGIDAGDGDRPDRAAPRRHRRPVRDDRQVPRRPQAVGARRRGRRRAGRRRRRSTPSRPRR